MSVGLMGDESTRGVVSSAAELARLSVATRSLGSVTRGRRTAAGGGSDGRVGAMVGGGGDGRDRAAAGGGSDGRVGAMVGGGSDGRDGEAGPRARGAGTFMLDGTVGATAGLSLGISSSLGGAIGSVVHGLSASITSAGVW